MEYIVDGILVLIFGTTLAVCAQQGLIRGIAGIAAWIAASVIALSFCAPLAQTVYDGCVQKVVLRVAEEKLSGAVEAGETADVAVAAYNKLPELVVNAASSVGVDVSALRHRAQNFIPDSSDVAASVEKNVLAPVIIAALKVLLFFLMVIVIAALGRLIFKPLGLIAGKIPVIKQADKGLGAVLGILKGAMIVSVLAIVLKVLADVTEGALPEAVSESRIVNFITESPFADGFFR